MISGIIASSAVLGEAPPAPVLYDLADSFTGTETGVFWHLHDKSTLFQDAAMTIPITASGQPLGAIMDMSGRGNHAIQPNPANRPLYGEGDGRHWVEYPLNQATWLEIHGNSIDIDTNGFHILIPSEMFSRLGTGVLLSKGWQANTEWYFAYNGGRPTFYSKVPSLSYTGSFSLVDSVSHRDNTKILPEVWKTNAGEYYNARQHYLRVNGVNRSGLDRLVFFSSSSPIRIGVSESVEGGLMNYFWGRMYGLYWRVGNTRDEPVTLAVRERMDKMINP